MKKFLMLFSVLFFLIYNNETAIGLTLTRIGDPNLVPLAGTYNGFGEITQHLVDYKKAVRVDNVEILHTFVDENSSIHIVYELQGMIKSNGNYFDIEEVKLIKTENGIPKSITIFYDTATWYAAFNYIGDVQDRRVIIPNHVGTTPGQSTDIIIQAYNNFLLGDIAAVLALFHPNDFVWSLKGDAFNDSLGTFDQGVAHIGTWSGIGDWFEQPYPTTGFIGFLVAMSVYEYVMPEPPDYEMPFQVKYIGSNGNFVGAHVQEIQKNLTTGQIAKFQLYHLWVLDSNNKVLLGYSFHDDLALCAVDPYSAFYSDLQ